MDSATRHLYDLVAKIAADGVQGMASAQIAARKALQDYKRDSGYNGWTNKESWAIALLFDNDEIWQQTARGIVQNVLESTGDIHQAADQLKEYTGQALERLYAFTENALDSEYRTNTGRNPRNRRTDTFLELLQKQALEDWFSEIDWTAVAKHYAGE